MKSSPLLLDSPEYPVIRIEAISDVSDGKLDVPLPTEVDANIYYDVSGDHFGAIRIRQEDRSYPYVFEIQVFSTFRIDKVRCKEAYKANFNPAVIGVNIARILYSSAREMLAFISARSPHGVADLPIQVLEPGDVNLRVDKGKFPEILVKFFDVPDKDAREIAQRLGKETRQRLRPKKAPAMTKTKKNLGKEA